MCTHFQYFSFSLFMHTDPQNSIDNHLIKCWMKKRKFFVCLFTFLSIFFFLFQSLAFKKCEKWKNLTHSHFNHLSIYLSISRKFILSFVFLSSFQNTNNGVNFSRLVKRRRRKVVREFFRMWAQGMKGWWLEIFLWKKKKMLEGKY
jgi:hypothetical protein